MKDFKELKSGPVRTGPEADPSLWSVSAIVMLGETAVTHPQFPPLPARSVPVEKQGGDRIFVREGCLITSAIASPAVTLQLPMLQEHLDQDVSLCVAKRLVVLLKRPEDNSRFTIHLAPAVEHSRLFNVQQYILGHLTADLSVNALARVAAMSTRNFTRVFKLEIGVSPSDYVDLTRIDVARFLLEGSRLSIASIAAKAGFGSPRAMRRAFLSHVGVTPSDYRDRFRTSVDGAHPDLSENS